MSQHMPKNDRAAKRTAAKITLLYALLGLVWMVLAGYVALPATSAQARPALLYIALVWGFIVVSAILLYIVLRDAFTDYERAEQALIERESTLQAIIAASPDAISILDTKGRIRSISPAIRELSGYSPAELAGQSTLDLIHPDDRNAAMQALRAALEGNLRQARVRFRYHHADGHWVILESHGRPLYDAEGQPGGLVVVMREVTERAGLETALAEAKAAAEEANRAKSEFLSRMSHELRTPLNAILGFAQLLELDELTPAQRESVQHILKAGRLLLDLINEVLDIARIETSNLSISLEPIHIARLIEESLDLVRPLAQRQGIHLEKMRGDCDRFVYADRQRLKQVLLNLFSNAIKYNRSQGRVTIGCRALDDQRLRIEVHDTGPGIQPEKMGRLFTPFDRLGAEQRGIEGTGLGLALSRRLIEAMGGTIAVESTPEVGSTFWIALPLANPPDKQNLLTGSSENQPGGRLERSVNILCIEDNLSNVRLIEHTFATQCGFQVETAMQGQIGIELARSQHPDLILLDLHLPDIPGEHVLQLLREAPETQAIPVLIISADATPGQADRLLALGAYAYLTKPLDIRLLLRLIKEILGTQTPQFDDERI